MSSEKQATVDIPKVYDPKQVEDKWYQMWLEKGYFNADVRPDRKPYTIVIPPPNVTAALHMGHAYNNTIQDILIRYKRKQGYEALWLPGTDHAGIATQNVVEKELRKENLTRHDLGREAFVKRVWEWKEKYGNTIINQLKKMGCSCDWRRERFTMDPEYTYVVREVFIRLYRKGWIYRGKYIINWCPRCSTALSDEEVEYKTHDGNLWYIKYPLKDSKDFIVVATTRPETMLGDTAVAVHPDDPRFQKFIGKTIILPLMQREIPVIADDQVDPEFGTGAVKVTPAHDPNDFQIAQRHQLPAVNILNNDGTLNENAGAFKGLDRFVARKKVVEALEKEGLLLKIESHVHNVGHCHRCDTVIEPWLSEQWFVRMKDLAEPAKQVVKDGRIKLHPEERWIKTYLNWLENIRDWCISRQLWWGHRIPVYYCDDCQHMMVDHEMPAACEKCGSDRLRQDEDVLDTWFSSWLWPFATLGWPKDTPELKYFYPTDTLVTGPDIIFFWVARMIMAGMEFMKEVPFRDVYLNGIVRDRFGRKMSKSLGNGIDPLDVIHRFSADAMRFTLIMLSSEGQDINLAEDYFEMGRNFSNKIWNAYRFLALNLDEPRDNYQDYRDHFELADRWILSRLNKAIEGVGSNLDNFRIHDSLDAVYHFFWDEFCDWYLELIKPRLYAEADGPQKETARTIATHIMKTTMNLLHPYIPFITEEIYQRLRTEQDVESVVIAPWPEPQAELNDPQAESDMNFLQQVISHIRTIRSEMNVPPAKKATLWYRTDDGHRGELLKQFAPYIQQLARVETIEPLSDGRDLKSTATVVVENVELFLPLEGLIDLDKERQRLEKEIGRLEQQVMGLQKKLSNEDFLQKAPAQVVQQEKEKMKNLSEKLTKLRANLKRLT
ncbi:MAG: valine--tRNA ligase [Calditrichaeota bacterium]|nr:valine--tRNA ligase [Calditrichota bacterium]